jgi:predicted lipoprotein with Yx(FWY)xxD motif
VLALTTACGQEQAPSTGTQNVGATAAAGGYGTSATAGAGNGYGADSKDQSAAAKPEVAGQLTVTESVKLGKVLTDGAGFTLYRFDKDTAEVVL